MVLSVLRLLEEGAVTYRLLCRSTNTSRTLTSLCLSHCHTYIVKLPHHYSPSPWQQLLSADTLKECDYHSLGRFFSDGYTFAFAFLGLLNARVLDFQVAVLVNIHCTEPIPKFRNKYSRKRNWAATVRISSFMCLWTIYIFLRLICLFCGRK